VQRWPNVEVTEFEIDVPGGTLQEIGEL
jgi:hypothetical protein